MSGITEASFPARVHGRLKAGWQPVGSSACLRTT
ncbi:MAG: DUF1737 domain-containing protein [Pseudomonadota bacterium]|nr:MAG: DUF1737 domain-containing protein [Pseudomonadota bacterium]